jgi:RNA polymerase sigma-70 factor (ECF subfamily)
MDLDRQLEAAVEQLATPLLRYCLGRTGDPSLAEEVAQEALTALVRRWRRLGPPDDPPAFVFGIARRRAGRALWRRRWWQPLDGLAALATPAVAQAASPADRAEARSELAAVQGALGRLPTRDRETLLLVAVGEFDRAAAAELLGISLSALKMRLHRARRRLVRELEKNDGRRAEDALLQRAVPKA